MFPLENNRLRANVDRLEADCNCDSPIQMDDTRPGSSNSVSSRTSPRRELNLQSQVETGCDYDYEQLKALPEEALLELYLEKIKRENGGDLALYLLDGNINNMLFEVYENDANYWERDADPTLWVPEHTKSRERSWVIVEEEQLAIAEAKLYPGTNEHESEVRHVLAEARAPSWFRKYDYGMNPGNDGRRMVMLSRDTILGERN